MKKRRVESAGLEEVERTLHSSFCAAANSISHLYTQAQTQNKIAFHAGQRHALEKLNDWIHQHHGVMPSISDISNYLKTELDNVSQTELSIMQAQNGLVPSQQHVIPANPFTRTAIDDQRLHLPFQHGSFPG